MRHISMFFYILSGLLVLGAAIALDSAGRIGSPGLAGSAWGMMGMAFFTFIGGVFVHYFSDNRE